MNMTANATDERTKRRRKIDEYYTDENKFKHFPDFSKNLNVFSINFCLQSP